MELQQSIVFTVTNNIIYDQRMQRISNTLIENGYAVTIIGRLLPSTTPTNFKFKTYFIKCRFNKSFLFYVEFNLRLFWVLLRKTNANIYCAIDLDTLIPNTLITRIKRKKLFFDAHEYFTQTPEVINRPLVKFIWGQVADICIPLCDKCYTVGSMLAEIFSKKYQKKFFVIRNVPLIQNNNPQKSVTEKIILYQGALNHSRGIEEVIEAMQFISGATLHIAGEGDLSAKLQQLTADLNLTHKVKFLGYVNPQQLKQITANATIGLNLLKHSGSSYYYSLANKFFDYIMAGKPQICANFPEYIYVNNIYHVAILASCNTTQIVNAINTLLNNTAYYHQLHLNCINARKDLNWQQEEQKLLKLYATER